MIYTKEQKKELFQNLPDDVKEAVSSVETTDIIIELEKKYKLHIDQTGELSNEVLLLTLGVTSPQKFIDNLESRLRISRDVAAQITADVNEKIFRPVRESLMKIHRAKAEEGEEATEGDSKKEAEKLPVKTVDIVEEKLSGTVVSPKKISTPDPYREAFK